MNDKLIFISGAIIIIVAIFLTYRLSVDTNEKITELRNEVSGQINKLNNNISLFAENIRTTTSNNIEQLVKISALNNQLGEKKGKSNILLISDTADKEESYYSESETSQDEKEIEQNIIFKTFDLNPFNGNRRIEELPNEKDERVEELNDDKVNDEPKNEIKEEDIEEDKTDEEIDDKTGEKEETKKMKDIIEYKLNELKDIAKEMKIPIIVKEDGKQRQLSKNEIYEKIKNQLKQ